jgi:glycosyltransferase involved in cell wall biosynthesis
MNTITFVSYGNIPSRRANAVHACKMAAALTHMEKKVELLTQAALIEIFLGQQRNVSRLYGLPEALRIRRLPLTLRSTRDADGLFQRTPYRRFDRIASLYCCLRRPDLVYTISTWVSAVTARFGISTALETHDMPQGRLKPALLKAAAASHLPAFKGLITISPILMDAYVELGFPEEKIIIAADAVDVEPFDEANETLRHTRKRQQLTVGYCGNLYRVGRGIDTILGCAKILPDVQFQLIGGYPDDVAYWKQQSCELANVCFVGHIPNSDVPSRLVQFDILCMPYSPTCPTSPWMSPMKLFEYMAAGRAIVATDLPSIRQILRHGRNALLCKPDAPAELAAAIRQLEAKPEFRETLGRQARADVANYTWKARAREIVRRLQDN